MQLIADWLEKLGMSEYAQRFSENGIDFTLIYIKVSAPRLIENDQA
jgi:SAM (Sterile alpha motif) domain-containing protein